MLRETRTFPALLVLLLTLFVMLASPVLGQDAAAPAAGEAAREKLKEQWKDMLHYIQMARADLAGTYATSILQAEPAEVYTLSIEIKNSQIILARALGNAKLKPMVLKIREKIVLGYRTFRSDEKEIQRMIDKLSGSLREYMRAGERLAASGEYALPQLLSTLSSPSTSATLRERISTILPKGGPEMVRGLTEALIGSKDERLLQHVANALGKIQYPHAIAHLKELSLRKDITDVTRRVVIGALVQCNDGDKGVLKKSLDELYYEVARKYYRRDDSVLPDERFSTANVWYFKKGTLTYKAVPREIFCDVYAMRMARKTLQANSKYSPAVSLWLGAYLKREANLPAGATDPLVPEGSASARDYTRAVGSDYAQKVLLGALRDADTAVALGAIEALRDVTGARNLPKIIDAGSVQPLVAAMSYADRRVRFFAAEVLALALPSESYSGYQIVIPVLNDALRAGASPRALLLATGEKRNIITAALRSKGYDVVASDNPIAGMKAVRQAGGVDIIVVAKRDQVQKMLSLVRSDASMSSTPMVAVGAGSKLVALAKKDTLMLVASAIGDKAEPVIEAVSKASGLAKGKTLSPEEASKWAVRAAKAIRLLGLTGNKIYTITRAETTLIQCLADKREAVSISAAGAVTVLPGPKAQQALATMADRNDASAEVRVAAYTALAESVRRFGNQLTKAQSQAVVDVVNSKIDVSIRRAASGALGALNLPSDLASPLILESGGID
ncbi:MAG: HEAT repeat domain-containing protein [bacterium]|nr:HEAT repeat domain-containing protein [bacterium]